MPPRNAAKSPARSKKREKATAIATPSDKNSKVTNNESPVSSPSNTPRGINTQTSMRQFVSDQLLSGSTEESNHLSAIERKLDIITASLQTMASKEYINEKLSTLVTKEALDQSLKSIKDSIKEDVKEEMNKVSEEVELLRGELHDVCVENESLKKQIECLTQKEHEHASSVEKLNTRNDDLVAINEELCQYTRLDTVRIFGMDDKEGRETPDQTVKKVITLLKDKLEMKVSEADISIAHRLGRFDKAANRPVICKFVRRSVKLEAIRNRKKLKGTAIVIKEDITAATKILMDNLKLEECVASVWFFDGKVFIKTQSGRIQRIRTWEDIKEAQMAHTSTATHF